jgi:phosphoadenosine phosphosulfate reductase
MPEEVLAWALDAHAPAIALGTGLGAEGMVVLDHLARMGRVPRVFMLDTGRLPQETHELLDRVRDRYRLTIEVYTPLPADLEPMLQAHGPNQFYRSVELRRLCCRVRKVLPLRRALTGLSAWITGLRRDGPTRDQVAKVEVDLQNGGLLKINPLADWSTEDVWRYIRAHDVPYNTLHDQGFPSIGCAPCTRAVAPGEDTRAGRWWWERPEHRECGIHAPGEPTAQAVGVR